MTDDNVKVVCSIIPGFETIAINECRERCDLDAFVDIRGRITFNIPLKEITKLVSLRSVHHYWVVVADKENFLKPNKTKDEIFELMKNLPGKLNWTKALQTWKIFNEFKQSVSSGYRIHTNKKILVDGKSIIDYNSIRPELDQEKIRFRCSATRTGEHVFTSMESACHVGGGVNDLFKWKVDLTNFDLEVVVFIVDDFISIGIQLTKESQSLRNITHFGPTTLKANICYCLIQLAQPKSGDIICDPMCGGCSIPLEGVYSFPSVFHVGGDNHSMAVCNSRDNIESAIKLKNEVGGKTNATVNASVLHWDVYNLPLRDASIDHIVTDLPFGKKIGNMERNLFLYPIALGEMARVCRAQGKAVLLTKHKQAMKKALVRQWNWWRLLECRRINMGGMNVFVYILIRTDDTYVKKEKHTTQQSRTLHANKKREVKDMSIGMSVHSHDSDIHMDENIKEPSKEDLNDNTKSESTK